MVEHRVAWVEDMPTFQGLFGKHSASSARSLGPAHQDLGSTLLRPFSLFSLFRTPAPALPSSSVLQPLHLLQIDDDTPVRATVKPLINLQTYSQQLKDYLKARFSKSPDTPLTDKEVEAVCELLQAYPVAVHVTSVAWQSGLDWDQDVEDSRTITRQSVKGLFVLRSMLNDILVASEEPPAQIKSTVGSIDRKLLSSTFPPLHSTTIHPDEYLSTLFTRPQQILTEFLEAFRPKKHSAKSISPAPILSVSPEDVVEVLQLLKGYAHGLDTVDGLAGPKLAKTKAQKEEDRQRPMRVAMEARVLRADLALSMANGHIKEIKSRAVKKLMEFKPGEGDEEEPRQSFDMDAVGKVHWDELAESTLIECFEKAKTLLESHRGAVLSAQVERSLWLGDDPRSIPLPPSPRSPKANGKGKGKELPVVEDEPGSDEDEDSDASSKEAMDTYPCPLRALLALHDRYEEQRLAVWLSLPTERRSGMGTYVRGEDGKVGEAWDRMGMVMLLDYDR